MPARQPKFLPGSLTEPEAYGGHRREALQKIGHQTETTREEKNAKRLRINQLTVTNLNDTLRCPLAGQMPKRVGFLALAAVLCVCVACSSGRGRVDVDAPPAAAAQPPAVQAPTTPAVDPIKELLAAADRQFEEGRKELALGHLARAKSHFNKALEVLLESPAGARSDARVREHFDRLVDRIAALELTALATGDGFTEQVAEPASIDELLTFDTTAPTASTAENVEADLQETSHDIPIPLNDRVLRYVELFQGRLREFLASGLSRGAQYLPMIQDVFRAEGLPLDLAFVPLVESAFKPTALSRAKARGVWQFMPGTGVENGLRQDWYIDERSDPEKATLAAAKYLKALHGIFDDWHLALASYNGGPGRVTRAMQRSRRDDFWTLTANSRYLPRETRDYVPMILAAVIIAKNPTKYGFEITPTSAPETETITVPPAVDLRRLAEWASIPVDDLQRLNPELRRWTTPLRATYQLALPVGTAEVVKDRLSAANPGELNALQWHTVKRGETLSTIARKLRVSRSDLAAANYLRTSSKVIAGQRLLIPRMPSAALLARAGGGSAADIASGGEETPAVFEEPDPEDVPRIVHRVRAGETLFSIARKYQTTVAQLKESNRLRSSTLRVGTRLVVQAGRSGANQQQ
jgi:membrane-bound lytic murein transglycosylase D